MKKDRNYGLDILRVIAIISVLSVHFFLNTKYYDVSKNGIGMKMQYVIRNIFMICVPLFILLTGYLNNNKKYDKKFFKGLLNVIIIWLFYSIIEFTVKAYITNNLEELTFKNLLLAVTSFKACRYSWYIEMYIGLYLLSPIINNAYDNFESKDKKILLLISIIIFILPGLINDLLKDYVHFPNWWYSVYPLGYYITGKYLKDMKPKYNKLLLTTLFIFIQIITFLLIKKSNIVFESLTVYLSSVIVFLLFYDVNIKSKFLKTIIVTISIMSLDIYLASSLVDHIVYTIFNSKMALYNIPQSRCILFAPIVLIITFILSSLYASFRRVLINIR